MQRTPKVLGSYLKHLISLAFYLSFSSSIFALRMVPVQRLVHAVNGRPAGSTHDHRTRDRRPEPLLIGRPTHVFQCIQTLTREFPTDLRRHFRARSRCLQLLNRILHSILYSAHRLYRPAGGLTNLATVRVTVCILGRKRSTHEQTSTPGPTINADAADEHSLLPHQSRGKTN